MTLAATLERLILVEITRGDAFNLFRISISSGSGVDGVFNGGVGGSYSLERVCLPIPRRWLTFSILQCSYIAVLLAS